MRRLPRATWIAIVAIGILAMLASVMGNIGASALTWLSPQVALVLFVLISLSLIGVSLWQERQKAASEPSAADARENRQIMLGRVRNTWITGFLENPLYYNYEEQLLPLPLRERVGSRFDLVLSNPLEPTQTMPSGTTITQVFDQAGGELLMLGEPGAGKTTLLLELARDLLKRAQDNPMAPIPVVLMLSSWATRKLPLEQWIAEELQAKYDIPSRIGKEWVKANQLLLLLDGLDEVAPSALPACIDAINAYYHQAHRSLVVCSRAKEFLDQPGRLALHTAVAVQPLSSEQIGTYLDSLAAKGEEIKGLKRALHQSATLRALATTPLFLIVLILAYHGKPVQELLALVKVAPTDQPHLLFHNYVEQMLQRKGTRLHAPAQQTKHWLAWLARQLTAHQQSELYLERLQPDWLPKGQRAFYPWSVGLAFGLVSGLLGWLAEGFLAGLVIGPIIGLLLGLLVRREGETKPVEVLVRSWKGPLIGMAGGLIIGTVIGPLLGLLFDLFFGGAHGMLAREVISGLVFGIVVGPVVGLVRGLAGRFSEEKLVQPSSLSPNEGIQRSAKNGLVLGLIGGFVTGLGLGLFVSLFYGPLAGLVAGLLFWLVCGSVIGLIGGLFAVVQHYTLRFWLARTHTFPWRAVPFLDDAVEQLLLRKVGGGYIFRHRLLQDYFASLDVVPPHDPSVRAEARSV